MSRRDSSRTGTTDKLAPYPQESLLIDAIPRMSGDRLVCTSAGRAQFAGAVAKALPHAAVTCTYLDLYRAKLATEYWADRPSNLQIECAADLPGEMVDVVALPFSTGGEADLARDLIQAGHQRLRLGGKLFASTDNAGDTWLGDQLGKIFRKVVRQPSPAGVLHIATKTEPLKKEKNFACEFAFRDRGRLIRVFSRPGVFSHRHIDTGARRLIDAMHLEPGYRVLDIGCGSGVVALAAACRGNGVLVHAVDSSARAVQCTARGAELNELTNLMTELNATGSYLGSGTYDLALANPPYYSSFRIAEHFIIAGRESLRPGGRILAVTKRPDWYRQSMPEWYDDVTVTERKGYFLIEGVRPDSNPRHRA